MLDTQRGKVGTVLIVRHTQRGKVGTVLIVRHTQREEGRDCLDC